MASSSLEYSSSSGQSLLIYETNTEIFQQTFTYLMSSIETLEKGVKYVKN